MKNTYISNDKFLDLLDRYEETKRISEELGKIFMNMADSMFGMKRFKYYTTDWKKEMKSEALYICCRYADRFERNKGVNPHAYFSKVIERGFMKFIFDEKKFIKKQEITNYACYREMVNDGYEEDWIE